MISDDATSEITGDNVLPSGSAASSERGSAALPPVAASSENAGAPLASDDATSEITGDNVLPSGSASLGNGSAGSGQSKRMVDQSSAEPQPSAKRTRFDTESTAKKPSGSPSAMRDFLQPVMTTKEKRAAFGRFSLSRPPPEAYAEGRHLIDMWFGPNATPATRQLILESGSTAGILIYHQKHFLVVSNPKVSRTPKQETIVIGQLGDDISDPSPRLLKKDEIVGDVFVLAKDDDPETPAHLQATERCASDTWTINEGPIAHHISFLGDAHEDLLQQNPILANYQVMGGFLSGRKITKLPAAIPLPFHHNCKNGAALCDPSSVVTLINDLDNIHPFLPSWVNAMSVTARGFKGMSLHCDGFNIHREYFSPLKNLDTDLSTIDASLEIAKEPSSQMQGLGEFLGELTEAQNKNLRAWMLANKGVHRRLNTAAANAAAAAAKEDANKEREPEQNVAKRGTATTAKKKATTKQSGKKQKSARGGQGAPGRMAKSDDAAPAQNTRSAAKRAAGEEAKKRSGASKRKVIRNDEKGKDGMTTTSTKRDSGTIADRVAEGRLKKAKNRRNEPAAAFKLSGQNPLSDTDSDAEESLPTPPPLLGHSHATWLDVGVHELQLRPNELAGTQPAEDVTANVEESEAQPPDGIPAQPSNGAEEDQNIAQPNLGAEDVTAEVDGSEAQPPDDSPAAQDDSAQPNRQQLDQPEEVEVVDLTANDPLNGVAHMPQQEQDQGEDAVPHEPLDQVARVVAQQEQEPVEIVDLTAICLACGNEISPLYCWKNCCDHDVCLRCYMKHICVHEEEKEDPMGVDDPLDDPNANRNAQYPQTGPASFGRDLKCLYCQQTMVWLSVRSPSRDMVSFHLQAGKNDSRLQTRALRLLVAAEMKSMICQWADQLAPRRVLQSILSEYESMCNSIRDANRYNSISGRVLDRSERRVTQMMDSLVESQRIQMVRRLFLVDPDELVSMLYRAATANIRQDENEVEERVNLLLESVAQALQDPDI